MAEAGEAGVAGSPEWRRTITASKVAPILGISPFRSQFQMWHEMFGDVAPEQMGEDRAWFGHAAEQLCFEWWARQDERRELEAVQPSAKHDVHNWWATPDFTAKDSDGSRCVIECKTTTELDEWSDENGDPAPPSYYWVQVLMQMALHKCDRGYIVALGPFFKFEIYRIDFDPELWGAVEAQLVDWEQSLADGVEPELDDTTQTWDTVRRLHPDIDKGETVEIGEDEAVELLDAVTAFDEAEKRMLGLKSKHLKSMGRAQKLMCGDVKIAGRQKNGHGTVSFVVNKKADLSNE